MNDVELCLKLLRKRLVDVMEMQLNVVRQPRRGREEFVGDVKTVDMRRVR